jgi:hypothetical protein
VHPLPIIDGDVGAGQQASPQRKRLGLLANPVCAQRLFNGGAPAVDVCVVK